VVGLFVLCHQGYRKCPSGHIEDIPHEGVEASDSQPFGLTVGEGLTPEPRAHHKVQPVLPPIRHPLPLQLANEADVVLVGQHA
jgi:hypothetical protein